MYSLYNWLPSPTEWKSLWKQRQVRLITAHSISLTNT